MRQGVKRRARNRRTCRSSRPRSRSCARPSPRAMPRRPRPCSPRPSEPSTRRPRRAWSTTTPASRYKSRLTRKVNALAGHAPSLSPPSSGTPPTTAAVRATEAAAARLDAAGPPGPARPAPLQLGSVQRRGLVSASSLKSMFGGSRAGGHLLARARAPAERPRRPHLAQRPVQRAQDHQRLLAVVEQLLRRAPGRGAAPLGEGVAEQVERPRDAAAEHRRHVLGGERLLALGEGLQLVQLAHQPAQVLADALDQLLDARRLERQLAPAQLVRRRGSSRWPFSGSAARPAALREQRLPGRPALVRLHRHEDQGDAGRRVRRGRPAGRPRRPLERLGAAHHDGAAGGEERARARGVEDARPGRLVAAEDLERLVASLPTAAPSSRSRASSARKESAPTMAYMPPAARRSTACARDALL